jgi:recombination protein RecA
MAIKKVGEEVKAGKKSMADLWKEMERVHGEEGLYSGNSSMVTHTEVIPTGSYLLDDAVGIGGWPRGHLIHFAGAESSGKTLMSLVAIAEYQKMNPDGWAFFIDAEFSFDAGWAKSLGVDLDRIKVYRENKAVQIWERLVGQPKKIVSGKIQPDGKAIKGLLDLEKECGGTGLGIIVLDSVAAIIPPIEEGSAVGKQNISPLSRFLPDGLRRLTPALADTGVTFIAINQVRVKPDVMYGNPETSPGGAALKHAACIMANFGVINNAESKIEVGEVRVGHHLRCKIQKNKVAPPFRVAEFAIEYTKGVINKNIEARDLGARYGIISRPNNRLWLLDGTQYNGKDDIANALTDSTLQMDVVKRAMEAKKSFTGILPDEDNEDTAQPESEDVGEE